MNNETELAINLWEKIKDFIPANKREDAAINMLDTLDGFLDEFNMPSLRGEDPILDSAISILYPEDELEEEDEFDSEWED